MHSIILDKSSFHPTYIKVTVFEEIKFQKFGIFFDDHLTIYLQNQNYANLQLNNGPIVYYFTRPGIYEVRTLHAILTIECLGLDKDFEAQEIFAQCPQKFNDENISVELQVAANLHETQSESRFGENLDDIADEKDEVRSAYFQEISNKNNKKKQHKHAFTRDRNQQISQADSQSTHHTSTFMHPKIETLSNYDENYQLQFQNESTQKGRKNSDPLIKSIKEQQPLKKIRIPKLTDNNIKPAQQSHSSETDSSDLNKHYLDKLEEFVLEKAQIKNLDNFDHIQKVFQMGEIMQTFLDNDYEIMKEAYFEIIEK